ncbi:hypothetical protein SAMN04488498_110197, partial [Mesorhizobium albiziae]
MHFNNLTTVKRNFTGRIVLTDDNLVVPYGYQFLNPGFDAARFVELDLNDDVVARPRWAMG